jgi:hypothetical protein
MPYGKNKQTPLELCHARGMLRQRVEALLRASGLEIRELASGLAIGNPRDPDRGRIHISYTSGEVSWKRMTWACLGSLQGYEPDDDPDREPAVDAATIISTLTGTPARATRQQQSCDDSCPGQAQVSGERLARWSRRSVPGRSE